MQRCSADQSLARVPTWQCSSRRAKMRYPPTVMTRPTMSPVMSIDPLFQAVKGRFALITRASTGNWGGQDIPGDFLNNLQYVDRTSVP